MPWSVVVNAGKFDVPLYHNIELVAGIYYSLAKQIGETDLIELKRTEEVRLLREKFIETEIPVDLFF